MYARLLGFLRCPDCGETLELVSLSAQAKDGDEEITEGIPSPPPELPAVELRPGTGAAARRTTTNARAPTLAKTRVSTTSVGRRGALRVGRLREGLLD
jgi:hypothetical protein